MTWIKPYLSVYIVVIPRKQSCFNTVSISCCFKRLKSHDMIRTLHGIKHKYDLLNLSCTVVQHLATDPEIEGSNLAGVRHEEEKVTLVSYFIEYNAHPSTVGTLISQWFLAKKLFLFFNYNFTRINHRKFIHHKSHLKPSLSYLPCIVCREYFSIIFNVKKCTLYSIKYST